MSKRVQGCFGVLCAIMLASCEALLGPPDSVNETAECPSMLPQEGVELVLAFPPQVQAGGDFVLEVRRDGVVIELSHDRGPLDWKGRPWLRPAYDEESQPMVRMTDGLVHQRRHRGVTPGRPLPHHPTYPIGFRVPMLSRAIGSMKSSYANVAGSEKGEGPDVWKRGRARSGE